MVQSERQAHGESAHTHTHTYRRRHYEPPPLLQGIYVYLWRSGDGAFQAHGSLRVWLKAAVKLEVKLRI